MVLASRPLLLPRILPRMERDRCVRLDGRGGQSCALCRYANQRSFFQKMPAPSLIGIISSVMWCALRKSYRCVALLDHAVIIDDDEPAERDFVVEPFQDLDGGFVHVAVEPQDGEFFDGRRATGVLEPTLEELPALFE